MEKHLNQVICMQDDLGRALKAYTEAREALEELKDYMDSGAWKEDYEADEAGRLPAYLPVTPSSPTASLSTAKRLPM